MRKQIIRTHPMITRSLAKKDHNASGQPASDNVTSMLAEGNGGLMFLDAPGGTGKTFLINLILASVRVKGDIALAVASSGIAATLLDGGRTAHSALKLPLDLDEVQEPLCNISKQSGQAKVLQHCKLIVWDECTMSHRKALGALDRTLQDLRDNKKTMGGLCFCRETFAKLFRFFPDLHTPADEIQACWKKSVLWNLVKRSVLSTIMRVRVLGDETADVFSKQLLSLGDGKWPEILWFNFIKPEWLLERAIEDITTARELQRNCNDCSQGSFVTCARCGNSLFCLFLR